MLPALLRRIAVQLFDNGVLRLIFENTRNMAVSSLITAAGLEVVRAGPGDLDLVNPTLAGYVVVTIGVSLLLLNLGDGLWRLSRMKSHLLLQILLCGAYAFIFWRVVYLVLYFKAGGGMSMNTGG
ncbi:hypothetical protein [Stenotrophomonas rhizophila]|uniref:hypothetical protein n=1 Tax=Stenotrophomonas rhizophila TaxID=216778 RepID=UPI001AEC4E20|nr:hypothetical protein [Stenotrophomonas rhizophila]